ncbi:MAG: hypothetical protein ACLQUY_14580, partial [Ktedonobacterales bacterium]
LTQEGQSLPPMSPQKTLNKGSPYVSNFWAGYNHDETNYQFAIAYWTVPSPIWPQYAAAEAPWVGMGGFHNDLLIQAGSEDIVQWEGAFLGWVKYQHLWIQNVGNTNQYPGFNPDFNNFAYFGCENTRTGDTIYGNVANGTGVGLGQAYMFVEDQNTGCVVSETFGPGGFNQQFECMMERPSNNWLLDFSGSQLTYSLCKAWTSNNGGFYVILGHNPGHWTPFIMQTGSTVCAQPDASTNGSGGYTVTFLDRCTDGPAQNHP